MTEGTRMYSLYTEKSFIPYRRQFQRAQKTTLFIKACSVLYKVIWELRTYFSNHAANRNSGIFHLDGLLVGTKASFAKPCSFFLAWGRE